MKNKRMIHVLAWMVLTALLFGEAGPGLSLVSGSSLFVKAVSAEGSGNGSSDDASKDASKDASSDASKDAYVAITAALTKDVLVYKQAFDTTMLHVYGVVSMDASGNPVERKEIALSDCTVTYEENGVTYTDLSAIGSTMGEKKIKVAYQDKEKVWTASQTLTVVPAKVENLTQTAASSSTISLSWNAVEGASGYRVFWYNAADQKYHSIKGSPESKAPILEPNTVIKNLYKYATALTPGTSYKFKVCAYYGTTTKNEIRGDKSDELVVTTAPDKVTGLRAKDYADTYIELAWNGVAGANGYIIYRKKSGETDYKKIGDTLGGVNVYEDADVTEASTYYYKICAYSLTETYLSDESDVLKWSTSPATPVVKVKAGDGRFRVTWKKAKSATGYQVMIKTTTDSTYQVAADVKQGTYAYIVKNLANNTSYDVVVTSYRTVDGVNYTSKNSALKSVTPLSIAATSKKAKLYKTKKKFKGSNAYKNVAWFKKYVVYNKSVAMPGTIHTNVAGFASSRMCPQAVAFAGPYMLMTAYDYAKEENSVIYVMTKKKKTLLTTIVLEDQVHVGGIAFDGTNVWVSHGKRVGALKYADIKAAAKKKAAYKELPYHALASVKTTASFMTYYKGMLYVGQTKETAKSQTYSYTIKNKNGNPTLTAKYGIKLPDRIQSIAFLPDGSLVISRSNLYMTSQRYYISQMDYYKPKWSGKKIKKLGKVKNTCPMPTMNEGIAVNGNYLYSCFESTVFSTATNPMDRICAFKLSSIKSGKVKK